jgi:hypothetical protein
VRRSATIWPYLLLLSACATKQVQISIPDVVIGTISDPEYTGWNLDLCNKGQVTRSLSGCAQLEVAVYEMEIYKVTLLHGRTLDGKKISPDLVVGFASHSLRKDYSKRERLQLQKAPDNLRVSTGIEYLALAAK